MFYPLWKAFGGSVKLENLSWLFAERFRLPLELSHDERQ